MSCTGPTCHALVFFLPIPCSPLPSVSTPAWRRRRLHAPPRRRPPLTRARRARHVAPPPRCRYRGLALAAPRHCPPPARPLRPAHPLSATVRLRAPSAPPASELRSRPLRRSSNAPVPQDLSRRHPNQFAAARGRSFRSAGGPTRPCRRIRCAAAQISSPQPDSSRRRRSPRSLTLPASLPRALARASPPPQAQLTPPALLSGALHPRSSRPRSARAPPAAALCPACAAPVASLRPARAPPVAVIRPCCLSFDCGRAPPELAGSRGSRGEEARHRVGKRWS